MRALTLIVLTVLTCGCASTRTPTAPTFDASGIFTRFERLRVAPADTGRFETMLKRCVTAAHNASLPESHEWLCYREPPGRYWIITFSETPDGFLYPPVFRDFVSSVAGMESDAARTEVLAMLDSIDYESEAWLLTRQRSAWSTVDDMSTATNPKARVMLRTIRPGMEEAFEDALARRTAFLQEQGYRLPIEGFVTLDAAPVALRRAEMQVVFPVDWPSFHDAESFGAFASRLDQAAQDTYAARKADLLRTMSRAEYFDGSHAPDLRYNTSP